MKKNARRIIPFLLIIGIIASVCWYLMVYDRGFTRDMLLGQARYHDTKGNNQLASFFYNIAYEQSGQDESVAIELAEQYKADGNYTKAEYTLTNAIADGGTADLYIALCKTFVEQDKLLDAIAMLDNIADPAIKAELAAMRPEAPTADPLPGFYSQYISVTISGADGILLCTTNGEYPSTDDEPCTEPIPLGAGETKIYAVNVAENGLISPLTILGYTIGGVIEEVTFTDPAMESAIRAAIGAGEEDVLLTNALWEITEFTVPAEAESFEDIALLPYVQSLSVEDKSFDSLACFSSLGALTELTLKNCSFPAEDLSILAALPKLSKLTLSDCGLSTIADLAGAPGLTYLDLSHNTLRNLEALSSMSSLREVYLQHNALTGLDALSTLTNLESLDVSYNSLTDLSVLAGCQKLSWLDAGHNTIASLNGVNSLPALTYLAMDRNMLTDISLLASCTGLKELVISNNALTDLSALSSLVNLEKLDFSYNQVAALPTFAEGSVLNTINGSYNSLTTIDSLKNLEQLTYVYMDYNQLTSIDALENCYHLVMVNVYGNVIEDVSALTEHDIIVNYDPTN